MNDEIQNTLKRIETYVKWNKESLNKLMTFTIITGLLIGIPIGMLIASFINKFTKGN